MSTTLHSGSWYIPVPFNQDHLKLQWKLGRLFVFDKRYPAHRIELKLNDSLHENDGTRMFLLSLKDGNWVEVHINQDLSVATLSEYETNSWDDKKTIDTYRNPMQTLTWDAENTDLQWEKGGRLFAVERGGKGKIELDINNAPEHDGQFIVDLRTRDNKFIRINASKNYDKAELLQFDSLDFAVDDTDRAVIADKTPVRQSTAVNAVIAKLQALDLSWVAEQGYLEWHGNQLFLVEAKKQSHDKFPVEAKNRPDSEQTRVEINLKAMRPSGKSITINIGSEKHRAALHIRGDLKSASLRILEKPEHWNDGSWKLNQERSYRNPMMAGIAEDMPVAISEKERSHIKVPYIVTDNNIELQWKLGRLFIVNKNDRENSVEANLNDSFREQDGTRSFTISSGNTSRHHVRATRVRATISLNNALNVATLTQLDSSGLFVTDVKSFYNPTLILSWNADRTDLRWEEGGRLYAVERDGIRKVLIPLGHTRKRNGQFTVDLKSTDNKLIRVNASPDSGKTELLQFDSLDFPVDKKGLAELTGKTPAQQLHFSNPAIAKLQQLDWVADHGKLQWLPGNRLFLVNSDPEQEQQQRVVIDIAALQSPGEPATINIAPTVKLEISADLKQASLSRSAKPDSWSKDIWANTANHVITCHNDVRDYITEVNGNKLDWVADHGELQWLPGNRLFLVNSDPKQNQRVAIDLNATPGKSLTIKMLSAGHRVVLNVDADLKQASLKRSTKPKSWGDSTLSDNLTITYRNEVRDYVTEVNGNKLDWVADHGELKWEPNNRLFLVASRPDQNQRVEIDFSATPGKSATIGIFSAGRRVVLNIDADGEHASLQRFSKPENWSYERWSSAQNGKEMSCKKSAMTQAGATDVAVLQNGPVLVIRPESEPDREILQLASGQQQPYELILEALAAFQTSLRAATGTHTPGLPAVNFTHWLVSPS